MCAASPGPAIGIAYAAYVGSFLDAHADEVDYVEIPFELLRHDPTVLAVGDCKPIILHCASLSLAGTVPCPGATVAQIGAAARRTATPWIGEHLAFVTAERPGVPGAPYEVGYTVPAPMNATTLERVARATTRYQKDLCVPLIVENSPIYFRPPTSTMSQAEFIGELHAASGIELLLDLAHFFITSITMGFDPFVEVERLPLEAVVEIHLSGVDVEGGPWDDHTSPAPETVRRLLTQVLARAQPRAITLEYNWSIQFPIEVLRAELDRTRRQVLAAGHSLNEALQP